jgi:glycosyltransferase involved in cell wall biosynthesis
MGLLTLPVTWFHPLTSRPRAASRGTSTDRDPIYVEISPLLNRRLLTGIGRFAGRLVEALARLAPLRLVNTIGGDHARNMRLSSVLPPGYEIAVTAGDLPPADHDVACWARQLVARRLRKHDPEFASKCGGVYTMLRPPERHFCREVAILYDFTPLLLPWAHVPETREHFGKLFAATSGLCDRAIAISRSTKTDARWLCALNNDQVVVCYPGPSLCVQAHAEPGAVTRCDNVILVVSTLEPRKNAQFLLDWYLETDVVDDRTELWWVGPDGWLAGRGRKAESAAGTRTIRFLGMVSDRRLCALYRQAALTIYPSLYEGFGFPVLDSLRHATPVLCSFNSSLAEFAGPGVFFFDARDPASLDAAYRDLWSQMPVTIDAEALRERFSWDAMARAVLEMCE